MTDAIKTGTVLNRKRASMPKSLLLEGNPYSSGWRSVSNLDLNDLDSAIHKAGWTVFFMAGEIKITAFEFDKDRAVEGPQGTRRLGCSRTLHDGSFAPGKKL